MMTLFIVIVVVGLVWGLLDGISGSSSSNIGALPPDMYDPLFDYDHGGKQNIYEKYDQFEAWENNQEKNQE